MQVLATAAILAVGVGAFAGLGGLREWRERSADQSFERLRAHDLRVDLAVGAGVPAGALLQAARSVPGIAAAEERLVADTQVDASRPGRPVLVPGRLIGVPPAGGRVDRIAAKRGRALRAQDVNDSVAVIDWNFAKHFDLPPTGTIRLAGVGPVRYVGQGVTGQFVLITSASGLSGAESSLAVAYVPLRVAQAAARRPGRVNELVLRVARGVRPGVVGAALMRRLRTELPGVGATVTLRSAEPAHRMLYRDARNDQKTYTVFAILLLAGAAFAAFNLVSRVVESQRREIGVGMALGVAPRALAVRPLALGAQIAVLGVLLGVPVGLGLSELIKSLIREFLPLPSYASTFPVGLYALASLLGLAVALAAAALPVRAAVRVEPIDAIRVGHRAAGGAGLARLLRHVALPGGSLVQMPARNLARRPRRTLMTVLGLGAVITTVVAVMGMVDSIGDTATRQRAEVLRSSPARLDVGLARPLPLSSPVLAQLARVPGVAAVEPRTTVGAQLRRGERTLDVLLALIPAATRVWRPSVREGGGQGGILIARKAADDLEATVGDTLVLRHPARRGRSFVLVDTPVRIAGIHGNPIRAFAFASARLAPRLGLAGLATAATLVPRAGADAAAIQRALFGAPGVSFIRPVSAEADAMKRSMDSFSETIRLVAAITLGLALLVAFTSTSISVEERRREYATMFAFGLPTRSGLLVAVGESLVTGILGTIVGLGLGLLVIGWIVQSLLPETLPDLGADVVLSAGSVATTLVVGVVAVALAPVLTLRRLRRMDVPSTLRVME